MRWTFGKYAVIWVLIGIWAGTLVYVSARLYNRAHAVPVVQLKSRQPSPAPKQEKQESVASLEDLVSLKPDPTPITQSSISEIVPLSRHPDKPYFVGEFEIQRDGVTKCDGPFGFDLMDKWNSEKKYYCTEDARLSCRVIVQPDLPPATRPHTMCDADRLVVDFSKFSTCQAPVERAEYGLGNMAHNCYAKGAFGASCKKNMDLFNPAKFPRDHLRDIFNSFDEIRDGSGSYEKNEYHTIFVTREGSEYANLFHTMCDWLNAFQTMYMMKWHRNDVQIIFLDNNPKDGPFDETWGTIFAPVHGVRRVKSFDEKRVMFSKAAFSPPGYSSILFNHVYGDNPCQDPTGLVRSFKYYFINAFGFTFGDVLQKDTLRVTLVSRKPYSKNGVEHSFMDRQLGNQDELVALMRQHDNVWVVEAVDFAQYDFRKQVEIISKTDVLVGVHGAALAHMCWLPEHAGVLELAVDNGVWNLFENMAFFNGVYYRRWDNTYSHNYVKKSDGSVLTVDETEFGMAFGEVVAKVKARKEVFRSK